MSVYGYKGLKPGGTLVTGVMEAASAQAARARLRDAGIFPTQVEETSAAPAAAFYSLHLFSPASLEEVASLTRQMATLLRAGIPLARVLGMLAEQMEKPRLKQAIMQVRQQVIEGSPLAEALRSQPAIFSELYGNMVAAGEASGTLDMVLFRLADLLDSQVRLRNKLAAALAYPVLLFAVGTAVLAFLVAFVVPQVYRIFEDFHRALPAPTLIVMAVSRFLKGYWWALIAGVGLVIGLVRWYVGKPAGRAALDRLSLKTPLLGRLVKILAVARFARTLGTLLASGVPIDLALEVSRNVVNNTRFSQAIDAARKSIQEGQSLAEPLKADGLFPPLVTQMIAAGEQSGQLPEMLDSVAGLYENQMETRLTRLMALVEPAMILVMGVVVGFIVLSILLPIIEASRIIR